MTEDAGRVTKEEAMTEERKRCPFHFPFYDWLCGFCAGLYELARR